MYYQWVTSALVIFFNVGVFEWNIYYQWVILDSLRSCIFANKSMDISICEFRGDPNIIPVSNITMWNILVASSNTKHCLFSNVIICIKCESIHILRLLRWTLLHMSKVKGWWRSPRRSWLWCGVALSEAVDLGRSLSHNFWIHPMAKWITEDSIIWHLCFYCRNFWREHVLPVSNVAFITKL